MRKPYLCSSSCSNPGAGPAYMYMAWGVMRTPGIGSVFSHAPPASGLSSRTQTLAPHLPRYAASATPLGPPPTITKSYLSSLIIGPSILSNV